MQGRPRCVLEGVSHSVASDGRFVRVAALAPKIAQLQHQERFISEERMKQLKTTRPRKSKDGDSIATASIERQGAPGKYEARLPNRCMRESSCAEAGRYRGRV